MKVFTIIVTYNGLKWLDKCISSVLEQSTVIVVDNNSSDNTLKIIIEKFPEVVLLPQDMNRGFGVANNIGISYAIKNGAGAVFLLNQDAYAGKDCIGNLVKISKIKTDYGIISPLHFNGNGNALDYSFQKLAYMSPLISDLITKQYSKDIYDFKFINAAAWFIPKDVFLKVGGFDPMFFMYGEDDNFSQRVLYYCFKVGVIPSAEIFHDTSNNNYELGTYGSEKYCRQFINSINVKYANINTDNYKRLWRFKLFLLKKGLIALLFFNISKAKVYLEKFQMVNVKVIKESVKNNKKLKPNYLDI
jgi:GT2 family glycosyltransferase